MFEGFEKRRLELHNVTLPFAYGGSGPPLLLLHGYPQTHVMWHLTAPALAEHFTVVAPDLRGYGDASKPFGAEDHSTYAKRAMAADNVSLMATLGFDAFALVGHDRGGRVGHRLALDHPERVTKLAVLDIVPTHYLFTHTDSALSRAYYHWFFLAQPFDLPERLIGADPVYYLHKKIGGWGSGLDIFAPEALAEYERAFSDPATIHASCEDYRAAATIDLEHDERDRDRKVTCPVLALWGEHGVMERLYDVLTIWRDYASDVQGKALPAGHFLAEEKPEETVRELLAFLQA